MVDLAQDHIGILGPDKGDGILVVSRDVFFNSGNQIGHAGKGTAADALARDFSKPTLDQIEPGTAGGSEMQVETRMARKPFAHVNRAMSAGVINNQMEIEFGRCLPLDGVEKFNELLSAMARFAFADNFAV